MALLGSAGFASTENASTSCQACALGKYAGSMGLDSCTNCPAGQFADTRAGKGAVLRVGGLSFALASGSFGTAVPASFPGPRTRPAPAAVISRPRSRGGSLASLPVP